MTLFNSLKNNQTKLFTAIALLLITAILIVEKINGRFWLNDFKVFYSAAEALLNNEQVYGKPFGLGTGFYKYSPFTLLFFTPYTLVSYETACILHFIVVGCCTIYSIILLEQIVRTYLMELSPTKYYTYLLILLCIVVHLVRELHLGNINMILVLLLSLIIRFTIASQPIKAGMLLAVVVLAKPYFIICALPFLIYKKHKEILSFSLFAAFFVFLSGVIIGMKKSSALYSEWLPAMQEHSNYLESKHTLFSLINTYFGISIPQQYSLPVLGVVALLLCFYLWKVHAKEQATITKDNQPSSFIISLFLLIAIIPNVLITDTEHFLFSTPLMVLLVVFLGKEKSYIWTFLFMGLMLFYGGNSSDLLGKKLAAKFEDYGLLGMSNLLIIGMVIYFYSTGKIKKTEQEKKDEIYLT